MSTSSAPAHTPRLTTRRHDNRVTPLELFFDLVFVLALTRCTALMAEDPTWRGLGQGVLVLGVLWWAWVGYAWLTSLVDPEEGIVRLVMFAATAAFLVAALCVPEAFGDEALLFAGAYAVARYAQLVLLAIGGREVPGFMRAVGGLTVGTTIGIGLITAAAFTDGALQGGLWALALLLDMGEPYLFGDESWRFAPGHFAERHGLIIIIALGESIIAIGLGAGHQVDLGIVVAAVLGVVVAAALWWLYFDVVALVAARRLENAAPGREANALARDAFSYLHFPMIVGIVLVALGMKKTLGHVEDPLKLVPAVALLGGAALYLLAHVAFRWRGVHRFSGGRVVAAALLLALIPAATELPSLATLGILGAVLVALIVYETHRFAELRARLRHQLASEA